MGKLSTTTRLQRVFKVTIVFTNTGVRSIMPLSNNSLHSVVEAMPLFDKTMVKVPDTVVAGTIDSSLQHDETS